MASAFPDVFALLEGEFGVMREAEEVRKNQKVREGLWCGFQCCVGEDAAEGAPIAGPHTL